MPCSCADRAELEAELMHRAKLAERLAVQLREAERRNRVLLESLRIAYLERERNRNPLIGPN